ncbi:hypothetical protein FACS189464_1350 [Bacteroidia bacterium]|nr:hypothetical protein FACS189464_1350 [Bacteroidia bacterium]
MEAVQGVTFEKDAAGNDRYIRIDMQRYAHLLQPFMIQLGIEKYPDDFEEAQASAISGDELRKRMHQRIDAWAWKDK